jgi:hypothetical protein
LFACDLYRNLKEAREWADYRPSVYLDDLLPFDLDFIVDTYEKLSKIIESVKWERPIPIIKPREELKREDLTAILVRIDTDC